MDGQGGKIVTFHTCLYSSLGGGCGSRTVDLNPGESVQFREATLFTSKENSKVFLGFFLLLKEPVE